MAVGCQALEGYWGKGRLGVEEREGGKVASREYKGGQRVKGTQARWKEDNMKGSEDGGKDGHEDGVGNEGGREEGKEESTEGGK